MSPEVKVQTIRAQSFALELMTGRKETPKVMNATRLPGGVKLGKFWNNCKSMRKCRKPPYDRLLCNTVLSRAYPAGAACQPKQETKVEFVRINIRSETDGR